MFGPAITDNAVPTHEAIEARFHVPAISVTGAEDWLGEWTFSLPQGSMTDEPIFWVQLLAKEGMPQLAVSSNNPSSASHTFGTFARRAPLRASGLLRRSGSPRRHRT